MKKYLSAELLNGTTIGRFSKYAGVFPNPDKILALNGNSYEKLSNLRTDAHVWSCIQTRKSGTLKSKWNLEGGDKELNTLLTEHFLKFDFYNLFNYILDALFFGFQPFEIVWEERKGYVLPKILKPKPQDWFAFNTEGKLVLIAERNENILPENKLIYSLYSSDSMNPYGVSLLSKCYWNVTFKSAALRFWANFMEKYGMPVMIGKFTRGATADEAKNLLDKLSDMAQDAVMVTPHDIDIVIHEAQKTSSVELYTEMINHCNTEISKAILSQNLTTEIHEGSRAASEVHYQVKEELIESDKRLIESFMARLLRYIANVNEIENEKMPIMKFEEFKQK